ncbi:AAA family ATPase [Mucilaginibacter sp.]|uniref:AAA family ATPase n=1 Tax=Mucilaginibacter sp. TaxID=1882438 RepID=UPI003B00CC2E
MIVDLKNIGAISHSEIDLSKDLIILSGPNNTGKTYIAYTLYAIYKFTREFDELTLMGSNVVNTLLEKNIELLLHDGKVSIKLKNEIILAIIEEVFEGVVSYLPNVFASDEKFFSEAKIKLQIPNKFISDFIDHLQIKSSFKFPGNIIIQIQKDQNNDEIDFFYSVDTKTERTSNSRIILQIRYIIAQKITESILNAMFNNVYITPTERTAINLFSKELSVKRNEIVDRLLEYKTNKAQNNLLREVQRYPLPIRDSLAIAEDLANLQKSKSDYNFIADKIEKEILKGKITVSKDGDVLFNPSKSNIKNLNIHLSASVVKSLSNLVFYFRHLAQHNDFIIIDEPELNLHPDNQIIMARLIAEIVNNGFKVLISTHSDYIVKELNNLIRINHGSDEIKDKLMSLYGYSENNLLRKEQIGVYLFKDKKSQNIPVDDLGFEVSTIEKENSILAEASERIYFEVFEK